MTDRRVIFVAVGDVSFHDAASLARLKAVSGVLKPADIAFVQLEGPLSAEGTIQRSPGAYLPDESAPSPEEAAAALSDVGANVVGIAGAHTMDRSRLGLDNTIAVLKSHGLAPIGAGADAMQARAPYFVSANGLTVGVLSYSSFVQRRNEATMPRTSPDRGGSMQARPGVAPMRARTLYRQLDWQPGTKPEVITVAEESDLVAVEADVRAAAEQADVVVVSFRWGVPQGDIAVIADYQFEVAHRVVDAGAALVFGHGSNLVQGIELYGGATIAYGIGGLSFRPRSELDPLAEATVPEEARWSAILHAELAASGAEVTLLPYAFGADTVPEPVVPETRDFDEYGAFLARTQTAPSTAKNTWDIHYLPLVEPSLALRFTGYDATPLGFCPIALSEMIPDPILEHRER